jgi:hypothetical protein
MPVAKNGNTETFQPRPRRFKDGIIDGRQVKIGRDVLVNCGSRVRRVMFCHVVTVCLIRLGEFRPAAFST